jgi:hypothetical protein
MAQRIAIRAKFLPDCVKSRVFVGFLLYKRPRLEPGGGK